MPAFFLSYFQRLGRFALANPTVAQKVPFSITPADADGKVVDLAANPTALTDITFSVDAPAVASLVKVDDTHFDLVPSSPGTVTVTVTAVNVNGATLTQSWNPITFDDVVAPPPPVPVVVSLGLSAGDPVSK
jgi:hypothetical protein